ncbi:hypothetical protein RMATCC62417_14222 [Rhizopus microsporus]|nr:hypothetical protein RMATCC62417_14222 [Rhizopus microsporus]
MSTITKEEEGLIKKSIVEYPCIQLDSCANTQGISSSITAAAYDLLCVVLLHTLHFIYIIYISFRTTWQYCIVYIHRLTEKEIFECIQYDRAQLTKIPKHLSIHISNELASTRSHKDWEEIINNVCSVSCWAWEFGIREISVYDASGMMKYISVDLYKQQSKTLNEWIKAYSTKRTTKQENYIKLSFLSGESGKSHMGAVVQRMAKQINVNDVHIGLIDKHMHEDSFSDSDLMIVYNGLPHHYLSLDGYSPWHIKLTEFINFSHHHSLNYTLFSKALYRFSKVEQRFGR